MKAGDPSDATSMAGCLVGALRGEAPLPESLPTRLEQAHQIGHIVDALAVRTRGDSTKGADHGDRTS